MEPETGMNKLIGMQEQLMEEVPHDVSAGAFVKMGAGIKIIDTLLRYLNSTGHKPWRPIPLTPVIQQGLLAAMTDKVDVLGYIHSTNAGADKDFSNLSHYSRQLISSYGIIEETLEYLDSLVGHTRAERLEELTDILFFYLEQVILSEFDWAEVEEEYVRKHAVNLKRYEDAKKGDYSWDKREEGGL